MYSKGDGVRLVQGETRRLLETAATRGNATYHLRILFSDGLGDEERASQSVGAVGEGGKSRLGERPTIPLAQRFKWAALSTVVSQIPGEQGAVSGASYLSYPNSGK
jgi:hypothetical protein